MRKFPAPRFSAEVALRLGSGHDGERAGLIVFGYDYAWLGLRRNEGRLQAVLTACESAHEGGAERILELHTPPAGFHHDDPVLLRLEVAEGALCRFSLSWDRVNHVPVGPVFQARSSRWVGAKVGLFASAITPSKNPGYATFRSFVVS